MFDVIIGNPPYQKHLGLEGGNKFSAKAIYHEFITLAKKLEPEYISMIIPSRWMTGIAKGIPKSWVQKFLNDKISVIHDYENYLDIFDTVGVSGGVCYFLWDKNNESKEVDYYFHTKFNEVYHRKGKLDYYGINANIRNPKAYSIINKIIKKEGLNYYENNSFSSLISAKGIFTHDKKFTTSWKNYSAKKDETHSIKYYISPLYNNKLNYAWVSERDIEKSRNVIYKNKVFISSAYGDPLRYDSVINKPFYGEPGSICSQTYLTIGHLENFTKKECINIMSYINTKFFRFLVRAKKTTQDAAKGVYQFVPLLNFEEEWDDEKLYKKYELTEEEILYIENTIPNFTDNA